MDSTVSANNYINSNELAYGTHYVTLASDTVTYANNKAKFILTYLTPNLSTDSYDTKLPKNSGSNVINNKNNSIGIAHITSSNYIELVVPKYLFYITDISHPDIDSKPVISRKEYTKGQKFLVTHMDKDFSVPYIIGVIE